MTDTGTLKLNDLTFTVPPDQIHIERKSYNNFWQTLRTRSSQKLRSGFSEIRVHIVIYLVEKDLPKLTDFVSQIRVTPFVYVDNQFLRNSILGGNQETQMVLALQQLEIQKVGDSTDIIQLSLNTVWFNYQPYMRQWLYKRDLLSPIPVLDPSDSRAWRTLYLAEQARKSGNRELYIRTYQLANKTELSLTEFALFDRKRYQKVDADVKTLRTLINQLEDIEGGRSEWSGVAPDMAEELAKQAKKQGIPLKADDFGSTTSMGEDVNTDSVSKVITGLLSAREEELAGLDSLMNQSEDWSPIAIQDSTGKPTIVESKLGIDTLFKEPAEGVHTEPVQVLMKRTVPLNLEDAGFIPVGISISFDNTLARIPLLGHPYPTYQHIGSIDGVVSISLMTTHESSIKSISNFYSMYEDTARKFRRVPVGLRNVNVVNNLINACGLQEFILENISIDTVKGQPGTYSAVLTLIDNPVTSSTREQLVPGQSITSKGDVHRLLFKKLMSYIKFDKSAVTNENGRLSIKTRASIEADVPSFLSTDTEFSRLRFNQKADVYKVNGLQSKQDYMLWKTCMYLASKMGTTLSELWNVLNTNIGITGNKFSSVLGGLFSLFLLDNKDVIGVDVFQDDTYNVFVQSKGTQDDIAFLQKKGSNGESELSWSDKAFAELAEYGPGAFGNSALLGDSGLLETARQTPEILDLYVEATGPISGDRAKALEEIRSTFRKEHTPLLYDFLTAAFADWNDWINNFLLQLLRSSLIQLDQMKDIRDALNNFGVSSGGNAYPDFPMDGILDIIEAEYPTLNDSLVEMAAKQNLGLRNLSAAALIQPDFYLYNPAEIKGSIVDGSIIEAAKNAIQTSQGDVRLKATKSWLESVYEEKILGQQKKNRIRGDVVTRTWGTGLMQADQKLKQDARLEREDTKALELELQNRAEKDNGLIQPNDFDGEIIPSAVYARLQTGLGDLLPITIPAIELARDIYNITGAGRKQAQPLASPSAGACKHNMSLDCLNRQPESYYQPTELVKASEMPIWAWPVDVPRPTSKITSHYKEIRGGISSKPHSGIDIAHSLGAEETKKMQVRAAADGEIVFITKDFKQSEHTYREGDPLFKRNPNDKVGDKIGNKPIETTVEVHIRHPNGYYTVYKHMQWEPYIQRLSLLFHGGELGNESFAGQNPLPISQGEVIGLVGNTGYSAGAHLHFEIRKNNIEYTMDPELALQGFELKSLGPVNDIDPANESLLTRSIDQFEKEMINDQGYSLMRAYPTFKLYFIESDLGERKKYAFDDFYSYSQVVDIQVIQSSKIPADLVMITLTNISGVLSNRKFKGDANQERARDPGGKFAIEDPLKENNIASLMLQPGTQMQLRLGFNNNPQELETVINGVITDVQFSGAEDLVQITCQSFAIELAQNIYGDVKEFGGWYTKSGRTSDILENLIAAPEVAHFGRWELGEGSLGDTFRSLLTSRYTWSKQPQDDNIFAPTGNRGLLGLFDGGSVPFVMYNTTIWDVFQEMTYRHPGWISRPVPYEGEYGPRMTMFFGVPDQFYFARDPTTEEKSEAEQLKEQVANSKDETAKVAAEATDPNKEPSEATKNAVADARGGSAVAILRETDRRAKISQDLVRAESINKELLKIWTERNVRLYAKDRGIIKPFRSYHLASSTCNIIDNRISSTFWNTFNTVTLQYDDDGAEVNEETGQIEFDDAQTFTLMCDAGIPDEEKREIFAQYPNCVGWEMAKRYCTALLKESLKEGYRGSLILMGNPKIRPYDIVYIADEYNDMWGPVEVEQVVHRFSQQHGFVTEIIPAMCIHVNEIVTMATQDVMGLVAEAAMKGINMQSLPGIGATLMGGAGARMALGEVSKNIKGDTLTAGLVTAASHMGDVLSVVTAPIGGMGLSTLSMASSMSDSVDNSVGNPINTHGLLGTFIFRKLTSRSQLAHLFHYSPLVLQGKPLIGGLPTKRNDGSWIQGIGRWFKDANESTPLYLDHFYDTIDPNNWFAPQGSWWASNVEGRVK